MNTYITYLRASTPRQVLSIEAQRAEVTAYAESRGTILNEYVEIASGAIDQRPQLLAAFEQAKQAKATLLVATLDRLSRKATYVQELYAAGIAIICASYPDASPMMIGMLAQVAQNEHELISSRTKAALAVKKAQGAVLGNPQNLTDKTRALGRAAVSQNARAASAQVIDIARDKRELGMTLAQIAEHLNLKGYKTRYGKQFRVSTVYHLLHLGSTMD